jgi:CubicO group peptidase (beta-lactamase class C family)
VYEVLEKMGMKLVHWKRGAGDCLGAPAPGPWPTATPGSVGLDGGALDALAARIEKGEIAGIHSVVIVRDGKLVFERYFTGPDMLWAQPLGKVAFGPETLHDLRSVTKSVVGVLVGIAHAEGAIPDLDAPLASFFPEHAKGREQDLAGRTLRHALTMSAGLAWDELTHPYWDPRNDEHGLWRADDPLEYALSRKPIATGGARFAYNGGMPTVLAAAIEKATKQPLDVFARERLWCPLGVTETEWLQHRSGLFVAASGLRLYPRDMARFGQLMLDDGRFAGRQIVPADYARASLSAQVSTGGAGFPPGYGYQWWIAQLPIASGNGGQRVIVDRERRMVTVITAGNYDSREQVEAPMRVFEAVVHATQRTISSPS